MYFTILRTCEICENTEERTFTDSYTGLEMCLMCLAPIANNVTNSPATEGDNIRTLIRESR